MERRPDFARIQRAAWWRSGRRRVDGIVFAVLRWLVPHVRGLYSAIGIVLLARIDSLSPDGFGGHEPVSPGKKESTPPRQAGARSVTATEAQNNFGRVLGQAAAWHRGRELLERAIEERMRFAFETTLGGRPSPAC